MGMIAGSSTKDIVMGNLDRIRRLSHALRVFVALGMAAFLIVPPLAWAHPAWMAEQTALGAFLSTEIALWQQVAGATIWMAVGLLGVWMLSGLWLLFGLYGRGRIFEAENVRALRRFGMGLVAYVVASIVGETMTILVLTVTAPPGERILAVGAEDSDAITLILACLFLVIARVMDEGRVLKEDQATIV